jgi:hypothetical protein
MENKSMKALDVRVFAAATAVLVGSSLQPTTGSAEGMISADANEILHSMADYFGGLKTFSMAYDTDTEIVTRAGQKLQLSASGDITVRRPDGAFITRKGPAIDAEIFYDGKNLSLFGKTANLFFQIPSANGLDAAIEDFRVETEVEAPGADLLVEDLYDALADGVTSGEYVGDGYVDGVLCYHLAFRKDDVDWQLWVRADEHPVPMKYVITTKWMTGAPQYSVRLHNWNFDPQVSDATFKFTPPADATELEELSVNETGEIVMGVQ